MRLIDADLTLLLLKSLGPRDYRRNKGTICEAMKMIASERYTPTINAVPVRHGRWGNYEPNLDGYRCSCCKLIHRTCTAYCPKCGAKMDEVSE